MPLFEDFQRKTFEHFQRKFFYLDFLKEFSAFRLTDLTGFLVV